MREAVLFPAKRAHALQVLRNVLDGDLFYLGISQVQAEDPELEVVAHHGAGFHLD